MPYKSLAQERYFHAHKARLEKQGVNVAEWDAASKGKKLPRRVGGKGLSGAGRHQKRMKAQEAEVRKYFKNAPCAS